MTDIDRLMRRLQREDLSVDSLRHRYRDSKRLYEINSNIIKEEQDTIRAFSKNLHEHGFRYPKDMYIDCIRRIKNIRYLKRAFEVDNQVLQVKIDFYSF